MGFVKLTINSLYLATYLVLFGELCRYMDALKFHNHFSIIFHWLANIDHTHSSHVGGQFQTSVYKSLLLFLLTMDVVPIYVCKKYEDKQ